MGLFLSIIDLTIVTTPLYTIALEFNSLADSYWIILSYALAEFGTSSLRALESISDCDFQVLSWCSHASVTWWAASQQYSCLSSSSSFSPWAVAFRIVYPGLPPVEPSKELEELGSIPWL